ncbi:thioredoxin-like protein AAED1, chloroplastic [Juglans regia]|uniref:Thioredoxin-like protein AAED1, chloroplastic n=1 Tax=Juglans regia TaxID=51240 RepID=A0A6P9EB56_JUGRE|nr:thioredoxin-like protein AAED1, chloroplastic [Juglans regia]
MATSLSTTLSTNNLYSNGITNPTSTVHLLPGLSPNRTLIISTIPKHLKYTTSFSPRQTLVLTFAILGSPDTASVLDMVKVFDLSGNAIPISDWWTDRKVVMAFNRHFGCVFCCKRADNLAAKKDIMDESSMALVVIGPGSIEQEHFEKTKLKGVYADPTHSWYEALQFVLGVSTTFTPKAGLKIIQLYMDGEQVWKLSFEKDTVTRGGWQQGGIIFVGFGKTNISFVRKGKEAGDDPNIKDILKACCS